MHGTAKQNTIKNRVIMLYHIKQLNWGKSIQKFDSVNYDMYRNGQLKGDANLIDGNGPQATSETILRFYKCKIIKIHIYHQGNMFQLQGAIIRPLHKNRSLSGFWCTTGIPIVYIILQYILAQYSIY